MESSTGLFLHVRAETSEAVTRSYSAWRLCSSLDVPKPQTVACIDASSLDESELPDRDCHSHDRVALPHRLGRQENILVDLPSTPRDHQVSHQQKAWAPDRRHPEHHGFHRVHARPRHDRWTKCALILAIAKRKLLCGAASHSIRSLSVIKRQFAGWNGANYPAHLAANPACHRPSARSPQKQP